MKKKKRSFVKIDDFFESSRVFKRLIRFLLVGLLLVILGALLLGIMKTAQDAKHLMEGGDIEVLRVVITDVLILLAVVEVYKTTFTYFTEGRVRVTYIVDTVLVVMIAEVMSVWFAGENIERVLTVLGILFSLILVRILAIRFHPKDRGE